MIRISAIFVALILALNSFSAVQAKPPVNQKAVAKAVQKELNRQKAVNAQRAINAQVRRRDIDRVLRQRALVDFNRSFVFRNTFIDPFGVRAFAFNPFLGNNFVLRTRNFAIGF